jgi:DNA-binding MarR family transcriptional regulator
MLAASGEFFRKNGAFHQQHGHCQRGGTPHQQRRQDIQVVAEFQNEGLQLRHHSAVGLVDRLVSARFVRRQPDHHDRRQVYLSLTRGGETVLEKLSAAHREQLRRLGPSKKDLLEAV